MRLLMSLTLALTALAAARQPGPPYRILAPGEYHHGEVKDDSADIWLGLFGMDCGYELRSVELVLDRVHDPIMDSEEEQTGITVTVSGEEGRLCCLILPPASRSLAEGAVPTVLVNSPELPPDTVVSLGGYGEVFTTEKGLFLTDGTRTQMLCNAYPDSHGESVSIVWAGDLDGDGRVDLVLNDRYHYAIAFCYRLYLSSEAVLDNLVEEVAVTDHVSC